LCRRCQTEPPTLTVRTEPLCTACFAKYISTKIIKRMESFRVRHSDPGVSEVRTLLLPLSLGACSTVLLHVLSLHLRGQGERTGRRGFGLEVLFVHHPLADREGGEEEARRRFERVQERYAQDGHTFSSRRLSDVMESDGVRHLLDRNSPASITTASTNATAEEDLATALNTLTTSPTSRQDLTQLLLRRLIVHHANQHACEAILWGDSTTRLAERTLSETAKGRGFAVPTTVADGDAEAVYGVPFYFPMRDLLRKEVVAYAGMIEPALDDCVVQDLSSTSSAGKTVSMKNVTIDDLMTQYFESVEQEYPSIVANVVKTAGKLRLPKRTTTSALNGRGSGMEPHCELCEAPLLDGQSAPERSRLCYGCIRTLPQTTTTAAA
ncbi:hypothetical protein BAUCODRAFT_56334, partial [Baudoinia panamericana UAMH 10762]